MVRTLYDEIYRNDKKQRNVKMKLVKSSKSKTSIV